MVAQDRLVIFFHGIGASGAQMMPLANQWRCDIPNLRFAAPDAPYSHWRGHQWFRIEGNPLAADNIRLAREGFDQTVADIIATEGFEGKHHLIAFVGVSQGAIVALDGVASGRWQVGAVVSFAGLLAPMRVSSKSSNTPVLLIHGQDDQTIPSVASRVAADQLAVAGFRVELDILRSVGIRSPPMGRKKGFGSCRKSLRHEDKSHRCFERPGAEVVSRRYELAFRGPMRAR